MQGHQNFFLQFSWLIRHNSINTHIANAYTELSKITKGDFEIERDKLKTNDRPTDSVVQIYTHTKP